jgi:hypothetical protein
MILFLIVAAVARAASRLSGRLHDDERLNRCPQEQAIPPPAAGELIRSKQQLRSQNLQPEKASAGHGWPFPSTVGQACALNRPSRCEAAIHF